MLWSTDDILAESTAWVWVPPGAEEVRTDRMHVFVRGGTATVVRAGLAEPASSADGATALLEEVRALARRHGAERLVWRVGPRPVVAGLAGALHQAGAEVRHREDVCALTLEAETLDAHVPAGVAARAVRSAGDLSAYRSVAAEVWGGQAPTEAEIADEFAGRGSSRPGGEFVAYVDGLPAGGAGYTLAGRVARLWGAGVLPNQRGRGAYRALVAARLADAGAHGATLGLVHAVVDTSAPILRRLGFTVYGENVLFALPLDADPARTPGATG